MCGTTQDQTEITDEQMQFYKNLNDEYSTIFGQSQAITGALTSAFQPILAAGPGQPGMPAAEEQALRTQNTESVATDYSQAQKATAQILAARGGGNTFLPSSVNANILAQNANSAAAQRAQGENNITLQNYQQGYQNWNTAANVLGSTAGLINPNSYASSTTNAGEQASKSATAAANSAYAPWGSVIGAAGSILGGKVAGMCWIAAELYGGWYEARTVLIRRWLIENFTGHWLLNLYTRYGERVAVLIRKHSALRWVFTRIFNQFLRLATKAYS